MAFFSSSLTSSPYAYPQNPKYSQTNLFHKPSAFLFSASLQQQHHHISSDNISTSPFSALSSIPTFQMPPNFTSKDLLTALRNQKDPHSTLQLFTWASKQVNFEPRYFLYEEVIQQLGKIGSFDEMKSVLNDMKVSGCEIIRQGTFLIFVESYAKFSLFDEAISVLEMMRNEYGVEVDTFTYNYLLNVLVDGNKLKLVEFVHCKMTSEGVKPDVSTFNILIKALCRAHQIRPAIIMMEEMGNYDLVPDEKTYTTLMQGMVEEGNMEGALRIKDRMVESGCELSTVSVNVLINGFCKEGGMEEALNFVQEMSLEGFRPDKFTFNTLVNGLCNSGHAKHGLDILDVMLQEGFDPDIFTYNTLISGLCKSGEIEDAVEVLNLMVARDCFPNTVTYNTLISTMFTYGTLISGLCKAGRVEIAGKLLRTVKMKGMAVAPQSYNPIIQALFKRQRTEEAMRLFREMMKNAEAPDAVTYKIVFRGLCCGGGPIKEAIDFMVEMTEKGYLPEFSSFSMLAEGLCALSMEDTLVKLVVQVMKKANFSASEVSMVMGFLKIRKFQDALATFDCLLSSRKPRKLYR
ncbi:hypothetical protein IFM89_012022 [Coptis chinensis]|uniref:Pentatricopeptide repeat-containing protein n=1 Tax=Coptis chinensis TaxID=261450 RepID=A0A835IVJ6_9MAGN|nr:hypothetical protein IFM89_012022 [Coptis chinensis]